MNGFEAARLRRLEIFEGRFNELIDFNAYSKSIQGQELTSYLLVMAPLKAKFDVNPLEREKVAQVCRFKIDLHGARDHQKVFKIMSELSGVQSVTLVAGKQFLEVTGGKELEPTKIAVNLKKRGYQPQLVDKWELPFLPRKRVVILSGCPVGREDPLELPSDVMCLRIFECHNFRSLSDMPFFQQTTELRFCSIHDCRGIESVLDLSSSSSQPCTPFQNLELLWLENLDNLQMLVKVGEASVVSTSCSLPLPGIFSHLKSFQIEGCSNMKQLFPFELVVHDLQNLEKLMVGDCGQMEEIISSEEEEENHKGKGICSPMTFSLPQLRELKLENLPKLKSICGSNRVMACDSLEDIAVFHCPNLKRMPLYLPLFQDTGQPHSHPFERIIISPKEWWKSVEWDYPNAKNVLRPWLIMA